MTVETIPMRFLVFAPALIAHQITIDFVVRMAYA